MKKLNQINSNDENGVSISKLQKILILASQTSSQVQRSSIQGSILVLL